jgi:hypothetical protein
LVAWRETTDRTLIEGPDLIIDCLAAYQSLTPLVRWVEKAML